MTEFGRKTAIQQTILISTSVACRATAPAHGSQAGQATGHHEAGDVELGRLMFFAGLLVLMVDYGNPQRSLAVVLLAGRRDGEVAAPWSGLNLVGLLHGVVERVSWRIASRLRHPGGAVFLVELVPALAKCSRVSRLGG